MHGTTSRVDPKVKERHALIARLLEAGITLADIDRNYGLSDGTMHQPSTRNECPIAPGLNTGSNAEATSKQPSCLDMDRPPFFPNQDANRPVQQSAILIFFACWCHHWRWQDSPFVSAGAT